MFQVLMCTIQSEIAHYFVIKHVKMCFVTLGPVTNLPACTKAQLNTATACQVAVLVCRWHAGNVSVRSCDACSSSQLQPSWRIDEKGFLTVQT